MKQASSHLLIILAIVLISLFIIEKGGVVSSFQDNVMAVIVNQRVGERRSVFSPSDIYKRLNENEKWLMGAILAQSEGQQELANYYFQLTANNDAPETIFYLWGIHLWQEGDQYAAIDTLRKGDSEATTWLLCSDLTHALNMDNKKEIEDLINILEQVGQDSFTAQKCLGYAYGQLEEINSAIQTYKKATTLELSTDELAFLYEELGYLYKQIGAFELSADAFIQAANQKPSRIRLQLLAAGALIETENYQAAEQILRAVVVQQPTYQFDALLLLGTLEDRQDHYQTATDWYEQAAVLRPEAMDPYLKAGILAQRLAYYEEALLYFEQASMQDPTNYIPILWQARIQANQNDLTTADASYNNALVLATSINQKASILAELVKLWQVEDVIKSAYYQNKLDQLQN